MNLLQKVALIIDMTTGDGGTYEDSFLNLIYKLDLPKTYSDDEPEIFEDLDFENFGFSKVTEDEIVFCAGGDWQTPLTISLKLNEFEDIYIAGYENGYHENSQIRFHDIIEKTITTSDVLQIDSSMTKNLFPKKKFFFTQDESSHWYMIPSELRNRWEELCKECNNENETACDILNIEFGQYRTGGGIKHIEFFIE